MLYLSGNTAGNIQFRAYGNTCLSDLTIMFCITCIDGGTLLNLKFTPASVEGEAGRIRLSAFLKSFLDLAVFPVQFTVVGHAVLRSAQAHPEEYKSLLVRVAGYSAYFVELSREVQDDILSRTAHAL